jgi:hypothetical protein
MSKETFLTYWYLGVIAVAICVAYTLASAMSWLLGVSLLAGFLVNLGIAAVVNLFRLTDRRGNLI